MTQTLGTHALAWAYTAALAALAGYALYAAAFDTRTGDIVFGWLGAIGCLAAAVTSARAAWIVRHDGVRWFVLHALQAFLALLAAIGFAAAAPA